MWLSPTPARSRRRTFLALLVPVAAVAALVLVLTAGDGSRSAGGGARAARGNPVAGLIDRLAAPWPKVQEPDGTRLGGHYHEPVSGMTRYGDSLMGYAQVMTGLATRRPELVRSGLRALRFSVPRAPLHNRESIFEILGIAGAYNLAQAHLRRDPLFTSQRAGWAEYLRHVKLERLPATTYFGNHWLVEAVEVRELIATGIRSPDVHSVLGDATPEAERLSRDLINRRIPAMARAGGFPTPIGRAFVLSDPPDNPLVYQGLSFGFYARGIQLLGERASPAARRALVQIARASLLLAAPDGDVAYFGRNQEEAWGLAGTALGAYEAASLRESPPALDARLRALADRALRRLESTYRIGRYGLNYAPIVRVDPRHALGALDPGAGGPSFAGLVQVMLEWARPVAKHPPAGATIPADRPLRAQLSHGESRFVVIRRGRFWYAIRPTTSGKHPDDIRADFGLIAFKARAPGGAFADALHLRPITRGGPPESAGPLLRTGGVLGLPFASRLRVARDATVAMTVAWRGPPTPTKYTVGRLATGKAVRALGYRPGRVFRAGVPVTYAPVPCGVRLTVPARAGDTIEYSVFLHGRAARAAPFEVSDATSRTTFNRPARVAVQGPYYSAVESGLTRARLTFASLPAGPLRITTCARP